MGIDVKKVLWDYFYRANPHKERASVKDIYGFLIDSVISIRSESKKKREPSMFLDGTMVGYSFQTSFKKKVESPSFRLLAEPGGCGINLPEQIDFTLSYIDALFKHLKWTHLSYDLNRIVRIIFPQNAEDLSDWWGGMWLGADFKAESIDLKVYMNLRHGSSESRWQKVADLFSPYAQKDFKPLFLNVLNKVTQVQGEPVGIGLVIRDGVLLGFRVYFAIERTDTASILSLIPENIVTDDCFNSNLIGLESILGGFSPNSVTTSYDFVIKNQDMLPKIFRFKTDINFQKQVDNKQMLLTDWAKKTMNDHALGMMKTFFSNLTTCFGGFDFDYLSLGLRNNNESHFTCYTKPHGLSREDRESNYTS